MTADRGRYYEIGLLSLIALGVLVLMAIGIYGATKVGTPFDPSAYLVVLTLIVGAIKESWLSRSVDRMGQNLANAPPVEAPPARAPASAAAAAEQVAGAAADEAETIAEGTRP